ncbi:MAG: hypothetical protein ACYC7L_02935 [Nitrospirota bacterium]
MRRPLCTIMLALLLFAGAPPVLAGEDAPFQAGIRMWLNNWRQDRPDAAGTSSDTTMLIGPAIEARLGQQGFLEASYLFSTADYRFSDALMTANVSRQDLDVAIGYRVIPEFGLFAGYRYAIFDEELTGIKDTLAGPVMGAGLRLPMDPWLTFYGKLFYLFTRFEQNDAGVLFREDSPGWGFEAGLKYEFTRTFLGSIGYRHEANKGKKSDVADAFGGVTVSAMVLF